MTVVTRFAPSPTGFLHIGGARTALFNWLFSRHHGGKFLLRIEDTDRARSTQAAVDAILDGLTWLGLDWDDDAVFQFARRDRHVEVARQLLDMGQAYWCYCTPEELTEMREAARREGRSKMYDGRWRDRDPAEAPEGIDPVLRFKAPQDGETAIDDQIQGTVTVSNGQLDDMVLLRADGTPTYMLSVVVDDHDMGITHIIRGDDHLTNAFRQFQLYKAMDWQPPAFAHQSLIHGPDGGKLSKRHGALGVETYRDDGYLPETMRNYLLRLGWSHGDDEIINTEQAIAWFDLGGVGRAPARFDKARLDNLNGHYIREADDGRLTDLVLERLKNNIGGGLADPARDRLKKGMPGLKGRAKTIVELAENSAFYVAERPLALSDKAAALLTEDARSSLAQLNERLRAVTDWTRDSLEALVREFCEDQELKLGKVAQPLRAALSGQTATPPIFEVMEVLGLEETIGRLDDLKGAPS